MISINRLSIRAVSVWPNRSRTTARATTPPAQAPSAWTNRPPISIAGEAANPQAIEAAIKTTVPKRIGGRRPIRSAAGP